MEEFFAVVGLIAAPLAIGFGVAFFFVRGELKRLRRDQPRPSLKDDRMDRLEQAVDAIAGEVERLAQSQHFTSRLLADRSEGDVSPRGRGSAGRPT